MGKKHKKSGNIRLPAGAKPPLDENVKLPPQVRHAAAVSNALARGQPAPPKPKAEPRRSGFPHGNAEIDNALRRLESGALQVSDPEFDVIRDLAKEGAQHIKSRRRGAREPRGNSDTVTRRMLAVLQAYGELSPKMRTHPSGAETIRKLRRSVIKKLGLKDQDELISEDLLRQDVQQFGPIFRLIREGVVPPPGPKSVDRKLSKKTQQEMIAGKRTLARHRSGH
jgi:hypothetical protein